jgi:TRAP transporter TAXI family solute receptor
MKKRQWSGIKVVTVLSVFFISVLFLSSAPAECREKTDIEILSMKFGGSGYVASFVLADLINKHSTWLRATALETGGTVQDIKIMNKERNRVKRLIGHGSLDTFYSARNAIPPFQEKYQGKLTWIARTITFLPHFVVRDPNIKTGADLKGKRVALPSAGSGGTLLPLQLLEHAWNISNDVKVEYLGWSGSTNALADGKVAAAWVSGVLIGGKLQPTPAVQQFVASGIDFHAIPTSAEDLAKLRQKGYPAYGMELQPGMLYPQQKQPIYVATMVNGFFADSELPNDIAYEICRIMYENYREFWGHHATLKGISPETMTIKGDEDECHPGAAQFYKEKGLL